MNFEGGRFVSRPGRFISRLGRFPTRPARAVRFFLAPFRQGNRPFRLFQKSFSKFIHPGSETADVLPC
jgi:hypothetical protein